MVTCFSSTRSGSSFWPGPYLEVSNTPRYASDREFIIKMAAHIHLCHQEKVLAIVENLADTSSNKATFRIQENESVSPRRISPRYEFEVILVEYY